MVHQQDAIRRARAALFELDAALRQIEGDTPGVSLSVKEAAFLGGMSLRMANRFAIRFGVKVQGKWAIPADVFAREMANDGKRKC